MAKRGKDASAAHRWRFFRAGGFDQVRLDDGSDLEALGSLDRKLWVALACPTKGLEFDERTLKLLDADGDGRIRAPEILAATEWACGLIKDPGDLLAGSPSLPLSAIDASTEEGKTLLASARQILGNLSKGEAKAISVEDSSDTTKIFAGTKFNGDGIVPVESAEDAAVAAVMADIVICLGSVADLSGLPGVDQARVDTFFAEAEAYSNWMKAAEENREQTLPFGEGTTAANAALSAVRTKVEDYFTRCSVAKFAAKSVAALNPDEKDYAAISPKLLTLATEEIVGFPLAEVVPGAPLPLGEGVNPAWAGAMQAFRELVVEPTLGPRTEIVESEWKTLLSRFSGYEAWMGKRAGALVAALGSARIEEILAGGSKAAIDSLIARDKALEPEAKSIAAVDKLVRYHRDLVKLLNNFVAFREFYGRRDKAVFQAGTLYLDQRNCDLCVTVQDMARHAALAGLAKTCLVYCDCTRSGSAEKMTIAAAFTDGDSDNLMVGRNGIFFDRKGRDWDATITKIIDNPISIRQAFWSPYKRFVRMIEETVAKRAAAAEAESAKKVDAGAVAVATADKQTPPAGPKKLDIGVVAALGVAVGAIGTAVASLVTGVMQLASWQIPLVFVAIMLVISGPPMIIAWLKLRQRNLGPLLDASGWAVNSKAKLNIPFGRSLTGIAALPPGAERDRRDPYAEKKSLARRLIEIFLILAVLGAIAYGAWYYGIVEKYWPGHLPKSGYVLEKEKEKAAPNAGAPAASPGAAPGAGDAEGGAGK